MIYPDWSPKEVVDWFENSVDKKSDDTLMVKRLLTRAEMKPVWIWHEENHFISPIARAGLVGMLFKLIDTFENLVKKPTSERVEDFEEIKKLSLLLARKLKVYKNEFVGFNSYNALIPREFGDKLIDVLISQECKEKIQENTLAQGRFIYWDYFLPPLDDLIESLSKRIDSSEAELSWSYPTKIRQASSLRTFLINNFLSYNCMPIPLIATFLSVALDDAALDEDIVRKAQKNLEKIQEENLNNVP